ncbi:hypothetical protein C8J57DRAFT_1588756 [Mycena rebaudengoi]|nr:hypothetical protein C8J57DRAFT_1588756 [Mycena rebaudengoi]
MRLGLVTTKSGYCRHPFLLSHFVPNAHPRTWTSFQTLESLDSELQPQLFDTSEPEVPISTLPSELICEIFFWTLPEKNYLPVPTSAQLKGSPWIWGHICRQWRALALAYSALWSSITVLVRESTSRVCAIPILKAQLRRSGDSLLDVFIIGNVSYTPENAELLRMLVGCCGRWRFLYTEVLGPIFSPIRNSLPLLKELAVILASSSWTPDLILPWAQLTEYNGSFPPLDHFRHLGAAPNLVNCDINVQTYDRYPHELYLIGACDTVQPFLDRSSCVLTRLTLSMCDSHNIIIPLLHSTPSLSTIQIDFFGDAKGMSSLISALTIDADSGGPCLCPNLTSISWTDRKCVLSHYAFADLVQSRWWVSDTTHCRRLRSVEILLGRARIFTARTSGRRMEVFCDEGLEVSIQNRRRVPAAIAKWRNW